MNGYVPIISDFILKLAEGTYKRYEGKIGLFYTAEEVSKHNQKNDFWIIVNNKVYDLTDYFLMHPGGANLIFKHGGKDATFDFEGMFHSRNAKAILEKFYIGKLLGASTSSSNGNGFLTPNSIPSSRILLNNKIKTTTLTTPATTAPQIHRVKIIEKIKESNNTFKIDLEIPFGMDHLNWVSPLTHVSLTFEKEYNGSQLFKSYTPISQNYKSNTLQFLIKSYENGYISKELCKLNIGDQVILKGPIKTTNNLYNFDQLKLLSTTNTTTTITINDILETTNNNNNYKSNNNNSKYLLLIAGGTGITPMIQTINRLLKNNTSNLTILLIYSNKTKDDIIYLKELNELKTKLNEKLQLYHILTSNNGDDNSIDNIYNGRIDQKFIENVIINIDLNNIVETLVCGPIEFNNTVVTHLNSIGINKFIQLE